MRFTPFRLLLAIACATLIAASADARPEILNWSNIAGASDVVNLQGSDFGEHATVWCSTNGGASVQLPLINGGNGVLHIRMPSPLGLYAICVKKGDDTSNVVYPNRAKPMHFDRAEATAGGFFRIIGRNLCASGFAPQVTLVSGLTRYNASMFGNGSYNNLSVQVPANVPKGEYSVYVSNGMGSSSLAESVAPKPIFVREPGPNTFDLSAPWAAGLTFGNNVYNVQTDNRLSVHAVGNGISNDQPAIQYAIKTASEAGGGVVYLPAGTYKMLTRSGPLMAFADNVVVQGAGQDKSLIIYGKGNPGAGFGLAVFLQTSKCGLCDLSIKNLNENNAWLNTRSITNEGSKVSQLFLARVKVDLQDASRIELKGDRILVEHCNLSSTYTLLYMGTCTNSRVSNNVLKQMLGVHLDLTLSDQCIVNNNKFVLDANQGVTVRGNVRHGMAIGFAHNLEIVNNTWTVVNGIPTYNNDGEAILSEGGGGDRIGEETGNVQNTTGSTTSVSKSVPYVPGTVMAIIRGKGAGQWRTVVSRKGTTINVEIPWSVDPDSSSIYSIFLWSNQNTTIANNTFSGWLRGVWTYQGSTTDTQISNNRFNGMDGIFFEPCQNVTCGNGQFNPVWNTVVDNNTLTSGAYDSANPKLKSSATATYINFTGDLQQTSELMGTMSLNNQVYKNTIIGTGATFFENDPARTEGYCNYLRVEAPHYCDHSIPAMLGTIFQQNSANFCQAQALLLNGGDYQTTIVDCVDKNTPEPVSDSQFYWNTPGTHGSVGTVILRSGEIRDFIKPPRAEGSLE